MNLHHRRNQIFQIIYILYIYIYIYCRAYVATIIRRGIGLTTGFIGSHTVTVYTLLQLTTVHYNTCRVFTIVAAISYIAGERTP
jgi:hypothetical protein